MRTGIFAAAPTSPERTISNCSEPSAAEPSLTRSRMPWSTVAFLWILKVQHTHRSKSSPTTKTSGSRSLRGHGRSSRTTAFHWNAFEAHKAEKRWPHQSSQLRERSRQLHLSVAWKLRKNLFEGFGISALTRSRFQSYLGLIKSDLRIYSLCFRKNYSQLTWYAAIGPMKPLAVLLHWAIGLQGRWRAGQGSMCYIEFIHRTNHHWDLQCLRFGYCLKNTVAERLKRCELSELCKLFTWKMYIYIIIYIWKIMPPALLTADGARSHGVPAHLRAKIVVQMSQPWLQQDLCAVLRLEVQSFMQKLWGFG